MTPGARVYIMPCAAVCGLNPTPRDIVRSSQGIEVHDALTADIVVARAPGALPFEVQWQCFLTGCTVANHAALLGVSNGTYVTYKAAVDSGGMGSRGARRIFLTELFINQHPGLAASVQAVCAMPNCGWSLVNQATYVDLVLANSRLPQRQRRDQQQIGIVADSQVVNGAVVNPVGQMFSPRMLVDKFQELDASRCGLGACFK